MLRSPYYALGYAANDMYGFIGWRRREILMDL
jgi:hypothetical protein